MSPPAFPADTGKAQGAPSRVGLALATALLGVIALHLFEPELSIT